MGDILRRVLLHMCMYVYTYVHVRWAAEGGVALHRYVHVYTYL